LSPDNEAPPRTARILRAWTRTACILQALRTACILQALQAPSMKQHPLVDLNHIFDKTIEQMQNVGSEWTKFKAIVNDKKLAGWGISPPRQGMANT
jgi:hypothetical protein